MASFRDHYHRSRISTLLKFLAAACVFLYFCSVYSWLPVTGNNKRGERQTLAPSLKKQLANRRVSPPAGFYISPNYVPENRTITAEDRAIVVPKTRGENIDWLLPFCQD
jgi:hypothetical protein